ncbi:MAG: NnrU family protein [Alphaproteobacteria bacterium]
MTSLILAVLGFVGIHWGISGTRLRDVLVRRFGEGPYMAAYSVASLALIVWVARAYNSAVVSPDNAFLWMAPGALYHLGGLVMLLATLFVVIGITTPSVTMVQAGPTAVPKPMPKGIQRMTRHPFLWGVALWAAFHLIVNGDVASLVLFGGFLVLTVRGTWSIDAKRAKSMGPAWALYAQKTSNIPFAAILKGKSPLGLGEIAWWQWLAALAIFFALFYGHGYLFGVSPVPGWSPPF